MKHSALRALVILGLATACNDVNEPGEFTAPLVALTFPPPVSSTDAETITVTGTASDPSGIAEVRVNGVLASTSDGFATWQANVPLALGRNTLTVAASDLQGNSDAQAAQAEIESQPLLLGPAGIVLDPSRQLALVLDSGIKAVDLMSGARTTISGSTRGTGPELRSHGIALARDRALVIHAVPAEVVAVDLVSGDRTILSDDTHGIGPPLHQPRAITVDGDRALVIDSPSMGDRAIVAVDLVSGDRTILSGPSVGSGPGFRTPTGIVLDGSRALVLDRRALLAVDLATGDRTILWDAEAGAGTGPIFSQYRLEIALNGNRVLVSDSGLGAVFAVDLVSGDRTILSDPSTGGGPRFSPFAPTSIVLDETDPSRALVVDPGLGAVLAVDLSSGERSFVSASSVGTGPPVAGPVTSRAIALEGNRALVVGRDRASLVAVDLASGERTIVSDSSTGNGPGFQGPSAVAVDGDRALVLTEMALFAIDLASGDRSILSDESTGEGPEFGDPDDMALAGGQAFVTDGSLLAVDLASGDRRVVSSRSIGRGPHFAEFLRGIVVDGNRAFVITSTDSEALVLEVDLASGDRRIVTAEFTGEGPFSKDCHDLVLDGDRLLVANGGTLFAVDLATGDRTILSDGTTGAGPHMGFEGIARSGDGILVTAPNFRAVLAVDPRFGQRVIVAR
jgi:hypothetical protein